eukprot:TRINITY_DN6826_c0_g2_i4.p1 TRINITY_DN6826_c0_g2~~TRINITY_DN6826_c0_g2_i4.p1  ORF type:complete len:153 (+),score=21.09 TRINITY_DN6826_c0_g2_i4:215-673(+)
MIRKAINQNGEEFLLNLHNLRAVFNQLAEGAKMIRLKAKVKDIIRPMTLYYVERFSEETASLKDTIRLFKSLRLFDVTRYVNLTPETRDVQDLCSFVPFAQDCLESFQPMCEMLLTVLGVSQFSNHTFRCFGRKHLDGVIEKPLLQRPRRIG